MGASREQAIGAELEQQVIQQRIHDQERMPSARFYKAIENIIIEETKEEDMEIKASPFLVFKKKFGFAVDCPQFHDLHAPLQHLKDAAQQLKERQEEIKGARLDEDLGKEIKENEQTIALLAKQLETFSAKQIKENLALEKSLAEISELISQENGDLEEKDVAYKDRFSVLDALRKDRESDYKLANQKYEDALDECCSCLSSKPKHEKRIVDEAKAKLDRAEADIEGLLKTHSTNKTKLNEYKARQEELKAKQIELITEHSDFETSLQSQLELAEAAKTSAEAKRTLAKSRQEVSNSNILLFLRVYVCCIELKNSVDKALKTYQEDVPLNSLKSFLEARSFELSPLLESLFCLDPARRNGLQLYQDVYLNLSGDDKAKFISGVADHDLQNKIAPYHPDVSDSPSGLFSLSSGSIPAFQAVSLNYTARI